MGVDTQKFIRKPLYVDAVRVSAQNFDDIIAWCQGEVQADESPGSGTIKKFIKVRVHNPKNPRQTKAFIGDWLLYTERGYKVYTNKAFRAAFDPVPVEETSETSNHGASTGADPEFEGVTTSPTPIEDVQIHSMGPVAENPSQETGVQPITEIVEATPESIAQAVRENEEARAAEETVDETIESHPDGVHAGMSEAAGEPPIEETLPVSEQPPEVAAAGKQVLSEEEQRQMGPDAVQELVRSGEAILAQDLAETS